MSPHKHNHNDEEERVPDTETIDKFKKRRWWAKWLSISGIAAIAGVVIAFPVVKDCFGYSYDLAHAPVEIKAIKIQLHDEQGQIDTVQMHEYEAKVWRAKVDDRLDNLEKLMMRMLDNQERDHVYRSPKQQGTP